MTDAIALMSNEEVMAELPTIEQMGFLGECSDTSKRSFLKYIYSLPLGRASQNYEVLSNKKKIRTTPFVRDLIDGYRKWLENDWAKSSDTNMALYNRAMEYINDE